MRKLLNTLALNLTLLLVVMTILFRITHHPVYRCNTDKVGETICKLIRYEGNK